MIPNPTLVRYMNGSFDLDADTLKVALFKNTTEYTINRTHEFVSDVFDGGTTGEEFDGTNYSRQGVTGATIIQDDTDNEAVFDCDDITFPTLGEPTGGQVVEALLIYKQVSGDDTTPGDDPIVALLDDSELTDLEKQTNGEDFTISLAAEGAINLAEA